MRVNYIAPKNVKQTHRRIKSHSTSAKRMTSILEHVAEAFPPARQRTILNSHRVIRIATNTLVVLNCAFKVHVYKYYSLFPLTYIMMTADLGLPDAV